MFKHSKLLVSSILGVLLTFFSLTCSNEQKYDLEYKTLNNSIWAIDDTLRLSVDISDTSMLYTWNFNAEILPEYPNSNIWLFVTLMSPGGSISTDTLEYVLADAKGEWYGTHDGEITISRNKISPCMKYSVPGTYIMSVVQGMRTDSLAGLKAIELNVQLCNSK